MYLRIALALALFVIVVPILSADILIRVQQEMAGQPVAKARIIVQTPQGDPIDEGLTDAKGEFVCKKLPNNHTEVNVLVAPAERDLLPKWHEQRLANLKPGAPILVKLARKNRLK